MERGELLEDLNAWFAELDSRQTPVLEISHTPHKASCLCTVHEANRGVMTELEIVRDVADGGTFWVVMAPDREEELVLGRRHPGGTSLSC